jgi:hypothetical protein
MHLRLLSQLDEVNSLTKPEERVSSSITVIPSASHPRIWSPPTGIPLVLPRTPFLCLPLLFFRLPRKFEFTTPRSRPVPCTYVDTPTHGVGRHDMCLETWSTRTRTSAAATSSVSAMNFSPSLIWLRNCSHIARRFCRAAATHSPRQRCVVSLYALAGQPLRQSCNTPLSPHARTPAHFQMAAY